MQSNRFVSALTLAAFLSAGVVSPVAASPADPANVTAPSPLRVSIDRVIAQEAQLPRLPAKRDGKVRRQMMGGGGGGGMMVMTLLITAASLAGTYFVMKELKKSTDEATGAK